MQPCITTSTQCTHIKIVYPSEKILQIFCKGYIGCRIKVRRW